MTHAKPIAKTAAMNVPASVVNDVQKIKSLDEGHAIKAEERILVKEFIQGIVLGLLGGFLVAYLLLS